jgi:hypothetical protein
VRQAQTGSVRTGPPLERDVSISSADVPDLLPMLSRGRHRNPRKGACFMELVSFLAGERWSDHPSCTHPLLAGLARYVNDRTSDAGRPQLAPLIPSVIGLVSEDPRVDARIALRCATTALPVAPEEYQRVLAVSLLACEQALAQLEDRPSGTMERRSREALASAPAAERWARQFARCTLRDVHVSLRGFRRHAAPNTVACAVEGIAHSTAPDPDGLLRGLLTGAIDDCAALVRGGPSQTSTVADSQWEAACRIAGIAPTA